MQVNARKKKLHNVERENLERTGQRESRQEVNRSKLIEDVSFKILEDMHYDNLTWYPSAWKCCQIIESPMIFNLSCKLDW